MAHQAYIDSLSVCDMLGDCVIEHELQQMRARLYLNLGLIFEIKQELTKASKYTHKSLTIARYVHWSQFIFMILIMYLIYYFWYGITLLIMILLS